MSLCHGGCSAHAPLPFQSALKDAYGALAAFLDATGDAGAEVIRRLEQGRPDPPITYGSVRDLRRLQTPQARCDLLLHLGDRDKPLVLKAFVKGVDAAEHAMWLRWHWAMCPDSHLHQTRREDLLLQQSLLKQIPKEALRVPLGAWQWRPGHECPRWESLQRAALWEDRLYEAQRRRLAAPDTVLDAGDVGEGNVTTLRPKRCTSGKVGHPVGGGRG